MPNLPCASDAMQNIFQAVILSASLNFISARPLRSVTISGRHKRVSGKYSRKRGVEISRTDCPSTIYVFSLPLAPSILNCPDIALGRVDGSSRRMLEKLTPLGKSSAVWDVIVVSIFELLTSIPTLAPELTV